MEVRAEKKGQTPREGYGQDSETGQNDIQKRMWRLRFREGYESLKRDGESERVGLRRQEP